MRVCGAVDYHCVLWHVNVQDDIHDTGSSGAIFCQANVLGLHVVLWQVKVQIDIRGPSGSMSLCFQASVLRLHVAVSYRKRYFD